jgi:hypothetical protein
VYQNSSFKVYIDGNYIGERSNQTFGQGNFSQVAALQSIGFGYPNYDPNDAFSGRMDNYRLWSTSLSQDQVFNLFNKTLSGNMQECKLNIDFNDSQINNKVTNSPLNTSQVSMNEFESSSWNESSLFVGSDLSNFNVFPISDITGPIEYYWGSGETTASKTANPVNSGYHRINIVTQNQVCADSIWIEVLPNYQVMIDSTISFGNSIIWNGNVVSTAGTF